MTTGFLTTRADRFAMAFGLLGGAVAWFLHLLAASVIAEWGCFAGIHNYAFMGVTSIAWLIIGASLLLTMAAAAATYMAYRLKKSIEEAAPENVCATSAFLAQAGVVTSGVFVFIILAETIPILFYLSHC